MHLKNIPRSEIVLQDFDLLLRLLLHLRPELLERLKLVDELVYDLPQPLVGKVQHHRLVGTQDAVEEVAVVVV